MIYIVYNGHKDSRGRTFCDPSTSVLPSSRRNRGRVLFLVTLTSGLGLEERSSSPISVPPECLTGAKEDKGKLEIQRPRIPILDLLNSTSLLSL